MVYITFINEIFSYNEIDYSISQIDYIDDVTIHVHIYSSIYNSIIALVGNETIINDVLQTSADMMIQTLSSNG